MAAKTVQCNVVVIALLLFSVAVAQGYDDADQVQKLTVLFEEALVNDNYTLWMLQQIFFNPYSMQSPEHVCLSAFVVVDTIADPIPYLYCQCPGNGAAFVNGDQGEWRFNSYYELHQQVADDASDTSELATLMTKSGSASMFYTMDPTFYSVMKSLSSSIALSIPYTGISNYDDASLRLEIINIDISLSAELDKMPCWDDAVYALRSVLMWVKFYARADINVNGTRQSREETDRSSVSDGVRLLYNDTQETCFPSSDGNVLIQPRNAWALVVGIFCFSNLLVLTSTLLHFRKVFLWLQQQNKQIKTLYKASATVLTCVNIIALISDLYIIVSDIVHFIHSLRVDSDSDMDKFIVIAWILLPGKGPLVLLILILETPVACFNTYLVNQPNTRCQRFSHAFALCQIIWFTHRLVNDAIISVIFFVLAPAQTLGIVTLLLATIASAIAFVAILIHNFKGCNKKMCTFMICVTLNGVLICGLLLAITLLFIVLVDNGLKSAGMGGLILSLVPPFAVFTIGLIINQKYFKSQKELPISVTAPPEPGQEPNQTTAIQMDDNEEEEGTPLLLQVRARP